MDSFFHTRMMKQAIELAKIARDKGEVPVGAVLSDIQGNILATAYNQTETSVDPTAHAEMIALRKGALHLFNYRLLNTILYVTIEPCVMCMGALLHARLSMLVYGAPDLKWGACGSLYDFSSDNRFNHRLSVVKGVCEDESRQLLQEFFRSRRKNATGILQ